MDDTYEGWEEGHIEVLITPHSKKKTFGISKMKLT
jgi:hypothetical protein